jgi:type IV secretory pathway VirJ component
VSTRRGGDPAPTGATGMGPARAGRRAVAGLATAALIGVAAGAAAQRAGTPAARSWDERTLTVPFVGQATAYVPKQPVTHVVLFISGDGGWNLGVVDMARRIMPKAIVVGISYVALRRARRPASQCWMPAGDLEEIAHAAERQLNLPQYSPPILIGYSSGATLVYGALATAPPETFSGGLSLGFCPDLPSDHPVCRAEDFKPTYDPKKRTAWLPKVASLPRTWYVLNGVQDQVCLPPTMHKFLDDMANVHFVEVPGTGHGFGRPIRWGQPFDDAMDALLAPPAGKAAERPVPAGRPRQMQSQLEALGLPLEYRWADQSRAAVLFLSGDGGWATLDDRVSGYLAAHGVSVVGLSSLRYFWSQKTPQQAGADLRRVVDVLSTAGVPLFMGGYSFGAEVTPFIIQTWPPAERRRVAGELLVAPGETASFEVSPLDWVFRARATPLRVADAVRQLQIPAICVAGRQEAPGDTACDNLVRPAVMVRLPGSHHFNGDYDAVGRELLDFIVKQNSLP